MNSLQVTEVDNEVLADADQYLREHKILELFEVCKPFRYVFSFALSSRFERKQLEFATLTSIGRWLQRRINSNRPLRISKF